MYVWGCTDQEEGRSAGRADQSWSCPQNTTTECAEGEVSEAFSYGVSTFAEMENIHEKVDAVTTVRTCSLHNCGILGDGVWVQFKCGSFLRYRMEPTICSSLETNPDEMSLKCGRCVELG